MGYSAHQFLYNTEFTSIALDLETWRHCLLYSVHWYEMYKMCDMNIINLHLYCPLRGEPDSFPGSIGPT